MRNRGASLLEVLCTITILGIVISGILTAFSTLWTSNNTSFALPVAQQNAQQIATTLSNAFRDATLCTSSDTGCTVGAPIQNASSTACTIYSRDSSNALVTTTYSMSGTNFQIASGSGTASTLYSNVSLTLTYYSSSSYYASSMTTFTPTSATASQLVAVGITVSATVSGITSNYTTLVRVRNY